MAALPSLITAATVAYVALFPDDDGRVDSSQALSRSSSRISLFGNSFLSNSFLAGIGVGVSLSWLASYEFKRRRLWQRVRLQFLSWLYRSTKGVDKDQGEPLHEKFRKPCRLTELTGTPIPRKSDSDNDSESVHGSHLELVSPDWALSANLYCDIVTLPPGTELVSRDSDGVEFYYVIKGSGTYVDNDGEKHQISSEYGFIVDPECNRGFLVGGKKEELVLLRATDIAVPGGNSHLTKLQASSLSSTVAVFKAGASKVYQFLSKSRQSEVDLRQHDIKT